MCGRCGRAAGLGGGGAACLLGWALRGWCGERLLCASASCPPVRERGKGLSGLPARRGLRLARLGGSAGRAGGSARRGEPADPPFSASLAAVAWQAPSASGSRAAPPPRTGPLLAGRHHADLPEGEAGGILAEREEDQETEFPGLRRAVPVRRRPSPRGAPGQAAAPGWGWGRSVLSRGPHRARESRSRCGARRSRLCPPGPGPRARSAPGTPPPASRSPGRCRPLQGTPPGMGQRPVRCEGSA